MLLKGTTFILLPIPGSRFFKMPNLITECYRSYQHTANYIRVQKKDPKELGLVRGCFGIPSLRIMAFLQSGDIETHQHGSLCSYSVGSRPHTANKLLSLPHFLKLLLQVLTHPPDTKTGLSVPDLNLGSTTPMSLCESSHHRQWVLLER